MLPPLLQKFLRYKAAVFSGVIALFGIANFRSISAKESWPQYEASVVSSSATTDPTDEQKATLHFSYRYQVDSLQVTSARVFASTFRNEPTFRDDVAEVVSRFPAGSKAMAYVNPDDVYDSYLDLTPAAIDYVIPALGAAGMLIFFTHSFAKQSRSNKSAHSRSTSRPD